LTVSAYIASSRFTSDSIVIVAPRHIANARKEIVLSSGAVNTPQIMMLSGIGDPMKLRELGIEPLVDLPDVGENLSDHPAVLNVYKSPHATEAHHTWLKVDNVGQYMKEWEEEGTGPLTSAFGNHMALVRLPESDEQMQKYGDPSAGPTSPHFELLFVVSALLPCTVILELTLYPGWSLFGCSIAYSPLCCRCLRQFAACS
jgi:choline dehydrogenase-like flavoprotein